MHISLRIQTVINWLDWTGVNYRDVFNQLFGLSFWRHPFTAEDSLFQAKFLQTISTQHQAIYILDGLRVNTSSFLGDLFLEHWF